MARSRRSRARAALVILGIFVAAVALNRALRQSPGPSPQPRPPGPSGRPIKPPPGCAGAAGFRVPFSSARVLPPCRVTGQGAIVDRLLASATSAVKPYAAYGSGYHGGKAKVFVDGLALRGASIPLEDSFGHAFATVRETGPGCFRFAVARHVAGVPEPPSNCRRGRDGRDRLRIEIIAPPCMSRPELVLTRGLHPASYLIDFVPAPGDSGPPPDGTATYAIVPARFVDAPPAQMSQILASYPGNLAAGGAVEGCGRPGDFRVRPAPPLAISALNPLPRPGPGAPAAARPLNPLNSLYINQKNYRTCHRDPPARCRADSYLNYYLRWAPSIRYLLSSTTAISGATPAHRSGNPPSGVIRAIIEDSPSERFQVYGAFAYSDPNVPCGQQQTARWVFGDANPGDPSRDGHIFGWLLAYAYGGRRRC